MKDFFISYTGTDVKIAEWIAWVLEDAGYTTVIQEWDFIAGEVFPWEMQKATVECTRTVIVLSPDFLKSKFTAVEWAAAFTRDPTGAEHKLVPVRISDFDVPGMLGVINYIDLVGCDEKQAEEKLITGIKVERRKPVERPSFEEIPKRPDFPFPNATQPGITGSVPQPPDEPWPKKLVTWLTIISLSIVIITAVFFTLPDKISRAKKEDSCLLWGLVEDQSGKPVPDAEIRIYRGAEDTTLIGKGTTTGGGEFRVQTQAKAQNTVYVTVTKNGIRGVDQFSTLGLGNTILQFKEP